MRGPVVCQQIAGCAVTTTDHRAQLRLVEYISRLLPIFNIMQLLTNN